MTMTDEHDENLRKAVALFRGQLFHVLGGEAVIWGAELLSLIQSNLQITRSETAGLMRDLEAADFVKTGVGVHAGFYIVRPKVWEAMLPSPPAKEEAPRQVCSTCRFGIALEDYVVCRRYPPMIATHEHGIGRNGDSRAAYWPEVGPDDNCGEHQFQEEATS